ncbi:T-cell receptor gamma chain V region PT-gamma-1/2, partial [Myotis brandtii]
FVFLSDTSGDIQITQALTSITKRKGSTAFLECQIRDILKKDSYIHWYRQKRDQALKRILSISSDDNVIHEQGVSGERYEARKHHGNLLVSLRIHRVEEADAGLYYCACWIEHCIETPTVAEQKPPCRPIYTNTHLLLPTSQRHLTAVH